MTCQDVLTWIQVAALQLFAPVPQPGPLCNTDDNLPVTITFVYSDKPSPAVVPEVDARSPQPVQIYVFGMFVSIRMYKLAKQVILPKRLCHHAGYLG